MARVGGHLDGHMTQNWTDLEAVSQILANPGGAERRATCALALLAPGPLCGAGIADAPHAATLRQTANDETRATASPIPR